MKHSELVLRPAILQPPQAQGYIKVRKSFGHNVLESCKVKEKNKSKVRKPPTVGAISISHPSFDRLSWVPTSRIRGYLMVKQLPGWKKSWTR